MVTRKIKGFPNHRVYSDGTVFNIKLKKKMAAYLHQGQLSISLCYKGLNKRFSLAKLVLQSFKPKQITIEKNCALHIDLNRLNCKSLNLEAGTRGDKRREFYRIKNKERGVYAYKSGKRSYRAVLKIADKVKTIGYFKTREEARASFIQAYKNQYGVSPYSNTGN